MQPHLVQSVIAGTQLWLSEPFPNDDAAVAGLELATL